MDPNEPFSQNIGPIWTPAVWSKGPDLLVKEAQLALFQERASVEHGALEVPGNSIAGSAPSQVNESERLIDGSKPMPSRSALWRKSIHDLYATEPLYGESGEVSGTSTEGTANPNA